jgi:hypothetical protein
VRGGAEVHVGLKLAHMGRIGYWKLKKGIRREKGIWKGEFGNEDWKNFWDAKCEIHRNTVGFDLRYSHVLKLN